MTLDLSATLSATYTHPPAMQAPIIAIGDLQGCYDSLRMLLDHLERDAPGAHYWFAGDLVNRGPDSVNCLRTIMQLGGRASCVLGNHDLHLLAASVGARKPSKKDTLQEVLNAPDAAQLIGWLRQQPLALMYRSPESNVLMVHAGVLPQWTAAQTIAYAREVQLTLNGPNNGAIGDACLHAMYGDTPDQWHDDLRGVDRLRMIVNGLTRLRFCDAQGRMDFLTKEGAGSAPDGLMPWFDVPSRATQDVTVIFGHWSTLGLMMRPNLIALDTGCVWGGQLTAVRLHDRKVWQMQCPQAQKPGKQSA